MTAVPLSDSDVPAGERVQHMVSTKVGERVAGLAEAPSKFSVFS